MPRRMVDKLEEISNLIVEAFKEGNKVLTFGVGGNATNAIHFAAELAGKYEQYEDPLPCIDLCSNPSVLTSITNDFGWEHVFERQIKALAKPGDVVVAFSIGTSGLYLLNALAEALCIKCKVALICGRCNLPDMKCHPPHIVWDLDSRDTPWVQEEQLRLIHQICERVKSRMEVD